MGQIIHLRNQFQSINPFEQLNDYTVTLIKRKKSSIFENQMVLRLKKLESPLHMDAFCQSLVEIGLMVLGIEDENVKS